jgi:uncharacterized protein
MTLVQVWNLRSSTLVASSVDADADRGLGLMFRRTLDAEQGVRLDMDRTSRAFSAIHMLFVFFPLAVFWLDRNNRIVDKALALPFRPFYMPSRPARYVLELHASTFDAAHIGDQLDFRTG